MRTTNPKYVPIYADSFDGHKLHRQLFDDKWIGKDFRWWFCYYKPMNEHLLFFTSISAN